MSRIAVTGAAGNVGQQAMQAFDDHDVTPVTHSEHDDLDSIVLDITDGDAFADALTDQDVLVHLAANPSPAAEWDAVKSVNIDGTYHAYEAAIENDLDRVVYASSNHAVGMYNADDPSNPESAVTHDSHAVQPDDPPNPDSYYGITKVTGEAVGSYYANRHDLEVVNLRIGWLMDEDQLVDTQDEPESKAHFARAMWLSPRDCRCALRCAVTADLSDSPVTVHVTSRNDDRYLSLTETATTIGYKPRDNATETLNKQ